MKNLNSIRVGDAIPLIKIEISNKLIRGFTSIANDKNASHYDDEVARSQGFKSAIVHGAIGSSFMLRLLVEWIGRPLCFEDEVKYNFVSPMLAGDSVTSTGIVTNIEPSLFFCDIWCENAIGTKLIIGKAQLITKF